MLACVIVAEWIVKDNSQFYKNLHNFLKKHFITISHVKKLTNVIRYVQCVFREHQRIHETCDFFESLFSLVKLFVRYTLFSRASVYCTKLFLTLSEVWCLLVLCLRSSTVSKSVLRYTHTHKNAPEVQTSPLFSSQWGQLQRCSRSRNGAGTHGEAVSDI